MVLVIPTLTPYSYFPYFPHGTKSHINVNRRPFWFCQTPKNNFQSQKKKKTGCGVGPPFVVQCRAKEALTKVRQHLYVRHSLTHPDFYRLFDLPNWHNFLCQIFYIILTQLFNSILVGSRMLALGETSSHTITQ